MGESTKCKMYMHELSPGLDGERFTSKTLIREEMLGITSLLLDALSLHRLIGEVGAQKHSDRKHHHKERKNIIVVIVLSILVLGSILYFLYKKAKLPYGCSGKQEIINRFSTKEKTNKDDIVMEMEAEETENSESSVISILSYVNYVEAVWN